VYCLPLLWVACQPCALHGQHGDRWPRQPSFLILLIASFRGERVIPDPRKREQGFTEILKSYADLFGMEYLIFRAGRGIPSSGKGTTGRTMFIDSRTATGIDDLQPDVRTVIAGHPDQVGAGIHDRLRWQAESKILIIGSGGVAGSRGIEGRCKFNNGGRDQLHHQ
jgi:hypothetical protein